VEKSTTTRGLVDDDDARTICTIVPRGLERVEEEEQMVRQEQQRDEGR
jgi:hypothetical protein